MNKVRGLLQAVGFLTLALLAIYGALAFAGGAGPLPGALSARAQEALPNAEVTAPEFVTGTVVSASPDGGALAPTVNYQGIIRLADGSFPPPGTTYDITARVYTNTVAPVAKAIYTTKKTGVSIRDGVFNIVLGDEPALPADAFSTAPRYVGIELGAGDGTHELIPRQRVHSVPWAMTASTLVQNAQVGDFGAQYIKAKGVDAADYVATKYVQTPGLTVMTNPPGGTGKLYVWGDAEVSGKLSVPRTYASFGIGASSQDPETMKSKPMGKWDVCFLVGAYTAGLTWKDWATYNDLGGLCHVIMSGFDGWFTEHPALTVTAGERRDWTLWVSAGKNAQSVNCAALCMNIGQ